MASGLLIKQKQLLAGDGITIEHAQTSSTISLSNSTLDAAVRIYDATIAADTGVVTITDGTPVSDLRIGDEIRTLDGVYQKTKDDITTGSIPDDGSHILISGCTDPTDVNGIYVATGEPNIWKNETSNNWISRLDGYGGPWWFIASSQAPSNPGDTSIRYRAIAAIAQNPWDANFTPSHAAGAISVQKYSDLVSKTDTIDLFEYASLPIEPENIVQSVNGNKPDANGNVTIETSSGGLTSVATGEGLAGDGTEGDPITLDLSNYRAVESDISLYSSGPYSVKLFKSVYGITINDTGITLKSENASILLGVDITYNDNPQNTAGGFAIVGSDGKLPSSILPDSSIDLSNYSTTSNISLKTTGSSTGITLGSTNGTVSIYSGYDGNGLSIGSTSCSYGGGNVSLSGRLSTSVGSYGAGTTTINATSLTNLKLRIGSSGTASSANTANGLVVVGSDGKIPGSVLPESTVDLGSYTGAVNITATSNATIRAGSSGNYSLTLGSSGHGLTVGAMPNSPTVDLSAYGSTGTVNLNSANINVGGSSGSTKITLKSSNVSVEPTTGGGTFSVDVTSSGSAKFTAGNIYFNNNASNTAGGFAIVEEDGKLPSSIIPVSSNRHPFTSSDLSSNVLTITTTGNVTGVIDDSGKAWNFADEEVTYTDSTVSVDLSGVFARKGIATPVGTWKLMLYGA